MPRKAKAKYEISAEDKTKQAIASARGRLDKLKSSVLSINGAISALAVGGLGLLIKRNLEAADAIGKAADTTALGVETFQELQQATERAGIEQSQFTSNMTAFVKRVGEARANTGPLVSFLKKYDETLLSAIQSTTSQEQALNLIADAIKDAKTETDRAAIANAAFSRAGVQMTVALRNGSEGLQEARDRARELGNVLDENLVRNAELANDRLDELKKQFSTQTTRAIVEQADGIKAVANALSLIIEKAGQAASLVRDAGNNLAAIVSPSRLDQTADRILEVRQEIEDLKKSIDDPNLFTRFQRMLEGKPSDAQIVERIRELGKELGLLDERFRRLKKIQEDIDNRDNPRDQPEPPPVDTTVADEAAALEIEKQKAKLDKKIEQLDAYLMTAEERERMALENRAFLVEEAFENEVITAERRNELLDAIDAKAQNLRIAREQKANDIILKAKQQNQNRLLGLARSFAGQNKSLAIAAIALEKAIAIRDVLIQNEAAAVAAGKHAAIAGGAPAYAAAYGAVKGQGALSVGLIAAQGLAEAANVPSGGASLGTPANPISTQDRSVEGVSLGDEKENGTRIVINLDGQPIYDGVSQATADGRITLDAQAVK